MTLLVIAAIVGVVLLVLFAQQQSNPRVQLQKAEKSLLAGDLLKAHSRFLRVITLVEAKGKSADSDQVSSRAHLAVGEIEQGQGRRHEAVAHYRQAKARGASVPVRAVLLLAECSAEKQETGDEVFETYLTYLTSGPRTGTNAAQVYAALQNLCQVTEDMKPAQRKPAAEKNRRVIAANPNLEWAHYFVGLASLLDGRAAEAIGFFREACKVNPNRALTYYWMGVCQMQLPVPALEPAIEMIEQFLSFGAADGKNRTREARACREIAKRLMQMAGGFSAREMHEEHRADLHRAIHYLELAAQKQPDFAPNHFELGCAYRLNKAQAQAVAEFRRASELNPGECQYAYQLGLVYFEAGRLTEAIEAFDQAVRNGPSEATHGTLGEVLFQHGDFERAATHLRAAQDSSKSNQRYLGLLVRALYVGGHYAEVLDALSDRGPETMPVGDDLDAVYAAGRSYSFLGQFEKVIVWLKRLGDRPDAIYLVGCAFANLENFAEAKLHFDELVGRNDKWASRAALQRGHVLLMQGDAPSAEADYRRAVTADPQNWAALRGLAELAAARGDFSDAVLHLSAAVACQPDNSELHLALAVYLERKGDLKEALRNYEYVASDTKFPSEHRRADENLALTRIGVIRCRLGDYEEAVQALEKCVASGEQSDTALFYCGLAYSLKGRCEDAIREWGRLQPRYPENERLQLNLARARYVLGAAYLSQGKHEAAIEQWEKYLCQYPAEENVARDLGELYFGRALEALRSELPNDLTQAREYLRTASQRDPQNRTYTFYAALCEARCGTNVAGAIAALRGLADEAGRSPKVLYHLGWCLLQGGKADEAASLFEEVRAVPDSDGYRQYASWALANLLIEAGRFTEASETLMSAVVPEGTPAGELSA